MHWKHLPCDWWKKTEEGFAKSAISPHVLLFLDEKSWIHWFRWDLWTSSSQPEIPACLRSFTSKTCSYFNTELQDQKFVAPRFKSATLPRRARQATASLRYTAIFQVWRLTVALTSRLMSKGINFPCQGEKVAPQRIVQALRNTPSVVVRSPIFRWR